MFSSSSSPSHLLSLAPPTMSTGTTGTAGSKLSASEKNKKHKVDRQGTFEWNNYNTPPNREFGKNRRKLHFL